jgi:hypothetical protein
MEHLQVIEPGGGTLGGMNRHRRAFARESEPAAGPPLEANAFLAAFVFHH